MKLTSTNRKQTFSSACLFLILTVVAWELVSDSFLIAPVMAAKNIAAKIKPVISSQKIIDNKAFQVATVVVEAPLDFVWSVLTSYSDAPKLCSKVTSCTVTKDDGVEKIVAFEVKTFRNLVRLEYSLKVSEHYPASIEFTHYSGALSANEGYWHLEPSENGRSCKVTYAKFVDGGIIPQYFVTKELKSDMPVILNNVRATAELNYKTGFDTIVKNANKIDAASIRHLKNITLPNLDHSIKVGSESLVARKP